MSTQGLGTGEASQAPRQGPAVLASRLRRPCPALRVTDVLSEQLLCAAPSSILQQSYEEGVIIFIHFLDQETETSEAK